MLNKMFSKSSVITLLTCLIATSGLTASETEGTLPPKEKSVNIQEASSESTKDSRYASQAERVAMDEKRLQYVEQEKSKSGLSTESSSEDEVIAAAHDWNMHSNCRHRIISIADDYSALRLEDGSLWQVRYLDRWTISRWFMEHRLYIAQNPYSSYQFRIINLDTNESVEANWTEKGDFMNPFARIIDDVTYSGIRLNDGTFWKVDTFDSAFFYNWHRGDMVIIGVNSGFSGYFSPYIIHNYNTNSYVIANLY